jgi:hypothetical protein
MRSTTALGLAAVVVAAVAIAVIAMTRSSGDSPPRQAATSEIATAPPNDCGRRVLADWFDNGIVDDRYPRTCHQRALELIPDEGETGAAIAAVREALARGATG